MTTEQMEQALQAMLAQMQSLQAQLAEANNNATKVASVEPKAEEKPRKKWYEMTDAEKAEARKEAAEKAKATPIEERKAAIEKKLARRDSDAGCLRYREETRGVGSRERG